MRSSYQSGFIWSLTVMMGLTVLQMERVSGQDVPAVSPAPADQFLIRNDPKPVLFFGDDATAQRMYSTLIETYTLSRFPSWKITFRNTGWQGDTIRFTGGRAKSGDQGIRRDIESFHPQLIVVNYGINDAKRGDAGFQQFSVGTNVLSRDMPRVGVYRAVFTSSNPAEGYEQGQPAGSSFNLTLQKFADEMKARFPSGWMDGVNAVQKHPKGPIVPQMGDGIFVDLFDPMLELIESGRKAGTLSPDDTQGDKTNRLAPDGVHPNWSGHLVMATLILQAMHAPALVSSATLDAGNRSTIATDGCTIAWQNSAGDSVQFERTDEALPWPIPSACEPALKLPGFDPAGALNQYTLKVMGLRAESYQLLIDDQAVALYSSKALAAGVNLGFVGKGRVYDQGQKLLAAVIAQNDTLYRRWHDIEIGPNPNPKTGRADLDAAGTAELARLDKLIADQEATRVDLGDISVGQTTERSFTISNLSTAPIVILGWTPTCHCVAARFPQTSVPPGGSINAYVQTSATTPLGKRAAIISIRWQFAGNSEVRTDNLVVSARYVSPLLFSEDRLDFSSVGYGEVPEKILLARPGNAAGNWNGLEVSPASDRLSARAISTPSGFRIDSRFSPKGLPSGAWKSVIRIFPLQDGKRTGQETDLPVVAKIDGPFAPSPPVLQFFERRNHGLSFLLKVHSSTVAIRRLRLLSDIVQNPQVKISSDGRDATVSGSLTQPARGQMFVGKIPLQINDGPEGALDVSFIGFAG